MAAYTYSKLQKEYDFFRDPMVHITVDDVTLKDNRYNLAVSNIVVDVTAGFEASQAVFELYNAYDYEKGQFEYDKLKKFILLGSAVVIHAGYNYQLREIFRGVIVKTEFSIEEEAAAHVTVTAMDVKGVMMANHYHKQFSAKSYSLAIKEIFDQAVYSSLKDAGVVTEYTIGTTPDTSATAAAAAAGMGGGSSSSVPEEETDYAIEMVGESDYEFVVRTAKKFNYEFFVVSGQVLFRRAKSDVSLLIDFSNNIQFENLRVDYDITGLVGSVEVRGLDVGKGKQISDSMKNSNKLSQGNKAKSYVSDSRYVYVDPTVTAKADATLRAQYLFEEMSYRLGTLELVMYGLPEIIPGRFISLSNFGTGVSNKFYVMSVQHRMSEDGVYRMKIIGKAQSAGTDNLSGLV